jgi:Cu-Zn family superoxide dismutase
LYLFRTNFHFLFFIGVGSGPVVLLHLDRCNSLAYSPFLFCPTVAVLRGDSNVSGVVTFEQPSESSPTTISWDITGNDPLAQRGMHIHQFGDNTNGCTSAGPHCKSGAMGA